MLAPCWAAVLAHKAVRDFFPANQVLYRFSFSSRGLPLLGCPKGTGGGHETLSSPLQKSPEYDSEDIMTRQSSHDKKLLNGTKPGCGLQQQQQTAVCVYFSTMWLNIPMSLKHKCVFKRFMSKSKPHKGDHKDLYTYMKPQKAHKHTKRGTVYLSINHRTSSYYNKALGWMPVIQRQSHRLDLLVSTVGWRKTRARWG